jgi:hypothetical protein
MAKAAFNKKNLFTSKLDLNLTRKLVKCYVWNIALCGAGTWTLQSINKKYLEGMEIWCWKMMVKISGTNHMRNEEVLQRVKRTGISYKPEKEGWLTGLVTCCIGTAF